MNINIPPLSKGRYPTRRSRSRDVEKKRNYQDRPERSFRQSVPNFIETSGLDDNSSITHQKIKRHFTESETQLVNDVIHVLKQQNNNLKDQNMFLLSKLRQVAKRQQQSRMQAKLNQQMSNELRQQNNQLKKQISHINHFTNKKVQEFGLKLSQLAQTQPQYVQQQTRKQQVFQQKRNSELDILNKRFQQLLNQCKIEQDQQQKKQYRRQLVELTNKMREIRK